jgi:hypothetical protein
MLDKNWGRQTVLIDFISVNMLAIFKYMQVSINSKRVNVEIDKHDSRVIRMLYSDLST